MLRVIAAALGLALGHAATVMGQTAAGAAPAAPPSATFVNLNTVSSDYQVGPGDLLDIQIVGHTELNQNLRVSNSGEISFPNLGLINVADRSTFEIEDLIAELLQTKGLIGSAQVLAFVRDYQAKPIYVSGAVVNPGQFVMSQEMTVVDAILLAGGLLFNAADEALVHRRPSSVSPEDAGREPSAAAGLEPLRVDLRPIKEGRFLENTLTLKRGDVLVIPDMAMNPFYVVGEVLEPRNFFYVPGQTLTASQAISWAGGPTPTAKMSDGMLVRYDDEGMRHELKTDYAAILRGQQPDFELQPHDIIFVPGSKVKTIAHGLLLLTDTMVMTTSFRIARTYQLPDAPDRDRDRQEW
jgi:polysaccharide biosynthesis/export protein